MKLCSPMQWQICSFFLQCKSFGSVVTQYFNYLRYWFLPYVTEDIEDMSRRYFPTNWIKGVLEIAPSLETVNAWIRTPSTTTNFSNIPVNPIMMGALRFNPTVSYFRRLKGECKCLKFVVSNNVGVIKITFSPPNRWTPSNSISLASILILSFFYFSKASLKFFLKTLYL